MDTRATVDKSPKALPERIRKVVDEVRASVASFNWDEVSDRKIDILKAFLQLAAAQGYSAITMRSLATALKLKAPSIYSHFPSGKDEIIGLSLRWQARVFALEVLEATRDAVDAATFLDMLARCHGRASLVKPENFLWDMIVNSDRLGEFLPLDLRNEMHAWIDIWIRLYAAAADALGYENTELKARQVLAAIDAVNTWARWDGSDSQLLRIQDEAAELCRSIMRGTRGPSA
jgi:AcrR family transcriptional regulator